MSGCSMRVILHDADVGEGAGDTSVRNLGRDKIRRAKIHIIGEAIGGGV